MTVFVYIGKAVGENMDFESGLTEGLTGVSYAEFCGDSADIYISCIKKLKDLRQRLVCAVCGFESGVLFHSLVASLVECKLFTCIWQKVGMDLASMGPCHAMSRPYAPLLLE